MMPTASAANHHQIEKAELILNSAVHEPTSADTLTHDVTMD
jgi:hypothetical protein